MQKIGILGGGQLGRMLLQEAANYPVETYIMENDPDCPSAHLCHFFTKGDIKSFEDVYNFAKGLDAVTIEIESVNEDALQKLQNEGVRIYPDPAALAIIKNKIKQKEFYQINGIPTADYIITNGAEEINGTEYPAIHKKALGGYDGRGVIVLNSKNDKGFTEPAVLEKKIDIDKEISVIAASNGSDIVLYPAVEMVVDPELNLLDYQICPARISDQLLARVEQIALSVVQNLNSAGIFAVEMFIDKNQKIWVNETAPRVHNSGHHTIEANYSSQFDMMWRIMLGYPLGNTQLLSSAAIVNIIGEKNQSGPAVYHGLNDVLKMDVFVHIYGKKETKPGRKMGHVTILDNDLIHLVNTAHNIKQILKVKAV